MGTAFSPTEFKPGQTPYSSSELNKLGQGIADAMPVGAIISSFVLHPGFVALAGQLLSRSTYDALFDWADANDLIGDGKPFGDGDGATNFRAPHFDGRMLIGADDTRPPGTTGGSDTHGHDNPDTSTAGSHSHSQASTGSVGSHSHTNPNTSTTGAHSHTNPSTGSGGSHAHTNPSTGSAGSHSHGSTGGPSSSTLVDTDGADTGVASASHTHTTSSASSHSHSVGNTGTANGHTHSVGNTGSNGDHAHSQGNTGSGGGHSHSNPDTSTESAHQHAQQSTEDADHLPPWGAVVWQIRY